MVFFTCGACGESLKKAQVEKHVIQCRGCQVLSCIDCGKDFWGDDFQNHNKCISEDQKYGGRGYEAKANKGDVKQQQWLQKIHVALSKPGVSASLQSVLRQVCAYDNVPRKRAKFQNWMRNSLKISNPSLHDEVWNILSSDNIPEVPLLPNDTQATDGGETAQKNSEKKKLNKRERKEARRQKNGENRSGKNLQENQKPAQEFNQNQEVQKKEVRKRRHKDEEQNGTASKKTKTKDQTDDDQEPEEREEQMAPKGKFNWKGNIKAVLRECPDQEISVKKLRKKVLAAYYSFTGDTNHKSEAEVLALFSKKINNNPKFRVLKDRVKLIK